VVGFSQAAAVEAITGAGLTMGTLTQQTSAAVPKGFVISQNPAAETIVPTNSAVSLILSSGSGSAGVPDAPAMNPPMVRRTTVTLFWNNVANETGYEIGRWKYDATLKNCYRLKVFKIVDADITTTKNTIKKGGTFCYAVRAFNTSGVSEWSNVVQVTLQP
jgi:hypothetical protein